MEANSLAPVVLFVYNRPWHTKQTVEALQKNKLASESELFIYSDAAKNETAEPAVNEVRDYIGSVEGFKSVNIIEREQNWGLADSIIDGVTTIVNQFGKIIVLEDDLVTSPYFLTFMNDALDFYQREKKVWHISGWNYPIQGDFTEDVFLWRTMNCWGWATWSDRWQYYEKDIEKTISSFTKHDIKRFNLDGVENFYSQVIANKKGKINTWAIFWYVNIFTNNGLCLNPVSSMVSNIGHDGFGVHCGVLDVFQSKLSLKESYRFETAVVESEAALPLIKEFMRKKNRTSFTRCLKKIMRWFKTGM